MGLPEFRLLTLSTSVPLVWRYSLYFSLIPIVYISDMKLSGWWDLHEMTVQKQSMFFRIWHPSIHLVLFSFLLFDSYCLAYSLLFFHICSTEGIIGTDEDILNCFIISGVLDFIGTVISRETDLHILVSFLLLLLLIIAIDCRNLHIIWAMILQMMIGSEWR